jgi:hypothetical protein
VKKSNKKITKKSKEVKSEEVKPKKKLKETATIEELTRPSRFSGTYANIPRSGNKAKINKA